MWRRKKEPTKEEEGKMSCHEPQHQEEEKEVPTPNENKKKS